MFLTGASLPSSLGPISNFAPVIWQWQGGINVCFCVWGLQSGIGKGQDTPQSNAGPWTMVGVVVCGLWSLLGWPLLLITSLVWVPVLLVSNAGSITDDLWMLSRNLHERPHRSPSLSSDEGVLPLTLRHWEDNIPFVTTTPDFSWMKN